jgi:hypothetical protein
LETKKIILSPLVASHGLEVEKQSIEIFFVVFLLSLGLHLENTLSLYVLAHAEN